MISCIQQKDVHRLRTISAKSGFRKLYRQEDDDGHKIVPRAERFKFRFAFNEMEFRLSWLMWMLTTRDHDVQDRLF